MQIAVFSDIHGNIKASHTALEQIKKMQEAIPCLSSCLYIMN